MIARAASAATRCHLTQPPAADRSGRDADSTPAAASTSPSGMVPSSAWATSQSVVATNDTSGAGVGPPPGASSSRTETRTESRVDSAVATTMVPSGST